MIKYGIRVNAVIVAESYTPLYEKWIKTSENPEEKLKSITEKIPLGKRMTTPEEIANIGCFYYQKDRAIPRVKSFMLTENTFTWTGQYNYSKATNKAVFK